jgi:hypothetical protein
MLHGHALAAFAHAAFNPLAGAEFLGGLLHVDGLAAVDERRAARDHEEPASSSRSAHLDSLGPSMLRPLTPRLGSCRQSRLEGQAIIPREKAEADIESLSRPNLS